MGWWFARLNCEVEPPRHALPGRVIDTLLWSLLGSRARCSLLWTALGLSGNASKRDIHESGVGVGAIDNWVARHPSDGWVNEYLTAVTN